MLVVLDGWGISGHEAGNAIMAARTPVMEQLAATYPHSVLEAHGESVGLLPEQMGNSNVGHLNLGAGRIVYQDLVRVNRAIQDGSFFENPAIRQVMQRPGALHLLGLVSDGGVHSHIHHLEALLEMARREGLDSVYVHAFLDGRDVGPSTALGYLESLEESMKRIGVGRVASVSGRYYAMDRDRRWERIQGAYQAMVLGVGITAPTPLEAVRLAYSRGETDEFVKPTVIVEGGQPVGRMLAGDNAFFFNFRADRARQITRALTDEGFSEFPRPAMPARFYSMTQYDAGFTFPVAFPPSMLEDTLGEVISRSGLKQLRIAETEKYAHVTFFFNGGREEPLPGEARILVPSPKVATYDLVPEMSAHEVTRRLLEVVSDYDFILCNYANPDMVGHTGIMKAAICAVEVVDECLGRVVDAVLAIGGAAIVVADHGNAEQMLAENGIDPHTAHTPNRVPCIVVDPRRMGVFLRDGILADVAPTILDMLRLPKPGGMTGSSMLDGE